MHFVCDLMDLGRLLLWKLLQYFLAQETRLDAW
jgi:hypothetical protein